MSFYEFLRKVNRAMSYLKFVLKTILRKGIEVNE